MKLAAKVRKNIGLHNIRWLFFTLHLFDIIKKRCDFNQDKVGLSSRQGQDILRTFSGKNEIKIVLRNYWSMFEIVLSFNYSWYS